MLEAYADGVEKCYIFLCLKPMQVVCRIVAKAQILRVCVTVCQTGFVSLTGVVVVDVMPSYICCDCTHDAHEDLIVSYIIVYYCPRD